MGNKNQPPTLVSKEGTGSGNTDRLASGKFSTNSTIEFSIECHDLRDTHVTSTMDPFVVVMVQKGKQWIEVARTEIIENTSFPVFNGVIGRFNIDDNQPVQFMVYDAANDMTPCFDLTRRRLVGTVTTTVGTIVRGAAYFESPLTEPSGNTRGMIFISGEVESKAPSAEVVMVLRCEQIESQSSFSATNTLLRISKLHPTGSLHWMSVAKTDNVARNEQGSVRFSEMRMPLDRLANSDLSRNLKIELFHHQSSGKHIYLAETLITLGRLVQLCAEGRGAMGLPMENKQDVTKKINTTIHFDMFQTYRTPSLEEYLTGGMEMAFSIAIEMPGHSRSMFATADSKMKALKKARDLYMDATQKVGDVMVHFDNDGQFPTFGFQGDRCWALNGNETNAKVYGTQGIGQIFDRALLAVDSFPKGPTLFEPVIQKAVQLARCPNPPGVQRYIVLLVLTDGPLSNGEFFDRQKTIDAVVEASTLPLSIMFVGVGDDPRGDEMKAMESLVKDCNTKASRELMQFVALKNLNDLVDPEAKQYVLTRQLRSVIPTQMMHFFWSRNQFPVTPGVQYGQVILGQTMTLPPPPMILPELGTAFLPPPPKPT